MENQSLSKMKIGEINKCKILIIGNTSVGKSCIMVKYTTGEFQYKTNTTVGHDYCQKEVTVDNIQIKLQIWDTAGQEKFRPIVKTYFKGAKGVFLVFDVTDPKSFEDIKYWMKEIDRSNDNPHVKMLLGNKIDLILQEDQSSFHFNEKAAVEFAQQNNMKFYLTSSKTGQNIDQAFQTMCRQIIETCKADIVYESKSKIQQIENIRLSRKSQEESKLRKQNEEDGCC